MCIRVGVHVCICTCVQYVPVYVCLCLCVRVCGVCGVCMLCSVSVHLCVLCVCVVCINFVVCVLEVWKAGNINIGILVLLHESIALATPIWCSPTSGAVVVRVT